MGKLDRINNVLECNSREKTLSSGYEGRLGVYCFVCVQIFFLLMKTLLILSLFLIFGLFMLLISMLLAMYVLNIDGNIISAVADGIVRIKPLYGEGEFAWILQGVLFVVSLSVFVIFMQKVIKMIIILCDLVFEGSQLAARIVLCDQLNKNRIIEDIAAIATIVRRKNSSGFFNNLLNGISD